MRAIALIAGRTLVLAMANPLDSIAINDVQFASSRSVEPVVAAKHEILKGINHCYPSSAERLWRDDALYDLVVVVGYNDAPIFPDKGSAIFLHVAYPDYAPTEGCVALAREDLIEALGQLTPASVLDVRR